MYKFNPSKLSVYYKDNVSIKDCDDQRKYTLTHSDLTGQLFLTIGKEYDYSKITEMRDEVLATWNIREKDKKLHVFLHLDTNDGLGVLIIRDKIFREELPLALQAIVYAEKIMLQENMELLEAPIIVHFQSIIPEYNVIEEWGKIRDYKIDFNRVYGDNGQSQEEILKESEEISTQLETGYQFESTSSPYHSAQTPYVHIGASHTPPSILPTANPSGKYHIIEKALIISLDSYIEQQVNAVFGKNTFYCLQKAKIIETKVVNYTCQCLDEYEILIGVMVGKKLPIYNNFIIRFLISEDGVKVLGNEVIK